MAIPASAVFAAMATLLGCSERTLERRVHDGQFPPPVQFGKDSCWFESVVHKWLEPNVTPSWRGSPSTGSPSLV